MQGGQSYLLMSIQIAQGIQHHPLGIIQTGIRCRAPVPGIAGTSHARQRGDDPIGQIRAIELPLVVERPRPPTVTLKLTVVPARFVWPDG